MLGEDGDRRDRHGDAIARGGHQIEIEVVDRFGGDRPRDAVLEPGAKRLGDELRDRLARQAVARVAGHLLGGAVHVEDHAGAVDDDDPVGGAVDEGAVALDGAHPPLLADIGERDAPGALAQRLERLRAAQDDAEQRRGDPPEADRGLGQTRRLGAVEPRHQRAGRLAADQDGEDGAGVGRAGHPHGGRRFAAADDRHLAHLDRAAEIGMLIERQPDPADLHLAAVGDQVGGLGIGQHGEQADRRRAESARDVLGRRVELALAGADRQHLRRLGQAVERGPPGVVAHARGLRVRRGSSARARGGGGGQHLARGDLGTRRQPPAVVELRLRAQDLTVERPELDPHLPVRRGDGRERAGQHHALERAAPQPQRRRVREEGALHGRQRRRRRQRRELNRRTSLLHQDRRRPDVDRAGREERVVERPDQLRAHVVDVRLDQHHLGSGRRILRTDRLAERHAQHVRSIGELAGPRAVADRARAHRGERPEPVHNGRQDRGARRRGQLPLPFGHDRDIAHRQERRRRRRRHRHRAVRRADDACPDHRRQRADRGRRQVGDRRRDPDDVGDRVVGPDLVEGDPIDAGAVQLGLDLGDAREDVGRQRARVDVEPRALQQPLDLGVVAVVVARVPWRGDGGRGQARGRRGACACA